MPALNSDALNGELVAGYLTIYFPDASFLQRVRYGKKYGLTAVSRSRNRIHGNLLFLHNLRQQSLCGLSLSICVLAKIYGLDPMIFHPHL